MCTFLADSFIPHIKLNQSRIIFIAHFRQRCFSNNMPHFPRFLCKLCVKYVLSITNHTYRRITTSSLHSFPIPAPKLNYNYSTGWHYIVVLLTDSHSCNTIWLRKNDDKSKLSIYQVLIFSI